MRSSEFLPALVLGALCGWMLHSLTDDPLSASDGIPLGDMLQAVTTLGVGWYIAERLRQRGEVHRIPVERVGAAMTRIEDSLLKIVGQRKVTEETLVALRNLSNEISWLRSVVEAVGCEINEMDKLVAHYVDFKTAVTGGPSLRAQRAAEATRSIRISCLRLQWHLCQMIVQGASKLERLP